MDSREVKYGYELKLVRMAFPTAVPPTMLVLSMYFGMSLWYLELLRKPLTSSAVSSSSFSSRSISSAFTVLSQCYK